MTLLKSQGHPQAHRYPLGKLNREADTARKMYNRKMKTLALSLQVAAPLGGFAPGKKAHKAAMDFLKGFDDGD